MTRLITYLAVTCVIAGLTVGRSLRMKREYSPSNWPLYWTNVLHKYGRGSSDSVKFLKERNHPSSTDAPYTPARRPPIPNPTGAANNEPLDDAPPGQNQTEILKECKKIGVKELRNACIRVATNPILKTMSGVRGYTATQSQYSIVRGFSSSGPSIKQLKCLEEIKCPNYNSNLSGLSSGLRSLSPWTMCHEFDPNRFPQWLNNAECLCEGCINVANGLEDTRNVFSHKLSVDISVLRKDVGVMNFEMCTKETCREDIERIAIGCHCSLTMMIASG